jgi:hypothetical protein
MSLILNLKYRNLYEVNNWSRNKKVESVGMPGYIGTMLMVMTSDEDFLLRKDKLKNHVISRINQGAPGKN